MVLQLIGTLTSALSYAHPGLGALFSIALEIAKACEQVQTNKNQAKELAEAIAELLIGIDEALRAKSGQSREAKASEANRTQFSGEMQASIKRLQSRLTDARTVIRSAQVKWLKAFLQQSTIAEQLAQASRSIQSAVSAFLVVAQIHADGQRERFQKMLERDLKAREKDVQQLMSAMSDIQKNQHSMRHALDVRFEDLLAAIQALTNFAGNAPGERQEAFANQAITALKTQNQRTLVEKPHPRWWITSFELVQQDKIGEGGFSDVFVGRWLGAVVAIKRLKTSGSADVFQKEVDVWSDLRKPHVLHFFGASHEENPPFIVMEYMANGTAGDYVRGKDGSVRIRIVHEMTIGLNFLHSRNVIHGDLKAINVLINDGGHAVLSDFGLSQIRADHSSRNNNLSFEGTLRWMSPERLKGICKRPSDIYAFGMTFYELISDTIPFGSAPNGFIATLIERGERPERPDDLATRLGPDLAERAWAVIKQCWAQDPSHRPIVQNVEIQTSALREIKDGNHIVSTAPPYKSMPLEKASTRDDSHPAAPPPSYPSFRSHPSQGQKTTKSTHAPEQSSVVKWNDSDGKSGAMSYMWVENTLWIAACDSQLRPPNFPIGWKKAPSYETSPLMSTSSTKSTLSGHKFSLEGSKIKTMMPNGKWSVEQFPSANYAELWFNRRFALV